MVTLSPWFPTRDPCSEFAHETGVPYAAFPAAAEPRGAPASRFPSVVSGSRSSRTRAAGIMYFDNVSRRCARSMSAAGVSAPTTYVTSRFSPGVSLRTTTNRLAHP